MQNIVNHVCSLNFASCMTIINCTYLVFTLYSHVGWFELQHNLVNHCFMNLIMIMCKKRKIFFHLERTFHGTYFSVCFYKDLICKFEKDVLDSLQKKDCADYSRFCRILYQACHLTYQLKVSSTYLWLAHPTNHRTRFRIRCSDRSVNLKSRDKPDIFLQGLKLIL